jgi:ArsR family transcriptional regulator
MAATLTSTTVAINEEKLSRASEVLRALAHPVRLKIVAFIDKNKEINVNKIYGALKLEQSITSQHLRILRNANIVQTHRNGKYIIYSVNYEKVKQYIDAIKEYLEA